MKVSRSQGLSFKKQRPILLLLYLAGSKIIGPVYLTVCLPNLVAQVLSMDMILSIL